MTGIDLAPEMVAIGLERAAEWGAPADVHFVVGDILKAEFAEPFDIVWSRDALMHLPDKPRLFKRLFDLLAPGGHGVAVELERAR